MPIGASFTATSLSEHAPSPVGALRSASARSVELVEQGAEQRLLQPAQRRVDRAEVPADVGRRVGLRLVVGGFALELRVQRLRRLVVVQAEAMGEDETQVRESRGEVGTCAWTHDELP